MERLKAHQQGQEQALTGKKGLDKRTTSLVRLSSFEGGILCCQNSSKNDFSRIIQGKKCGPENDFQILLSRMLEGGLFLLTESKATAGRGEI